MLAGVCLQAGTPLQAATTELIAHIVRYLSTERQVAYFAVRLAFAHQLGSIESQQLETSYLWFKKCLHLARVKPPPKIGILRGGEQCDTSFRRARGGCMKNVLRTVALDLV